MNTIDIERIISKDPKLSRYFEDVLPKDKLPKMVNEYPKSFIVNTDNSDELGQHWVAFYFDTPEYAEFFDSYGQTPEQLAPEFTDFISTNSQRWISNSERLQGKNTTVCGQYCIVYLYYRCRGVPMQLFVKQFTKNTTVNDTIVNDFVNDCFEQEFPMSDKEFHHLQDKNVL